MGQRKQLERKLLEYTCSVLQEHGFSAKIIDYDAARSRISEVSGKADSEMADRGQTGQNILEIELFNVGDRGDNQLVQISFLPATEEIIEITGFNTMQLICCINEDLPAETCNELVRIVLKINPKIVAGAFNVDEKDATFFYKSSVIITDNMDEETAFSLIQVHLGIFLSDLDTYNDVLMDAIEGIRTADEAILKGII